MSKVLIVEDDRELAQLMSRAFEAEGIAAVIASRAKTIRKDGRLIALSPREFQLASVLRQHRGHRQHRGTVLCVPHWNTLPFLTSSTTQGHAGVTSRNHACVI